MLYVEHTNMTKQYQLTNCTAVGAYCIRPVCYRMNCIANHSGDVQIGAIQGVCNMPQQMAQFVC